MFQGFMNIFMCLQHVDRADQFLLLCERVAFHLVQPPSLQHGYEL